MSVTVHRGRSYDLVKRTLDVVGAGAGLVVLSPLMAITAIIVRKKMGSPVMFKQQRPGLNGKVFDLYKFRSMQDVDASRGLITDEQRLSSFGRILRSTSLDELPSLWNVFRGDMSFVGPRPLLVSYLELYTKEQAQRHLVRPGITGLAQVSGRNNVPWEQRFILDVKYVDERSLFTDAMILWKTLHTVVSRRGVSQQEHATMQPFGGSNNAD